MGRINRLNKSSYDSSESTLKIADEGMLEFTVEGTQTDGDVLWEKDYSHLGADYVGVYWLGSDSSSQEPAEFIPLFNQVNYVSASGNESTGYQVVLTDDDVVQVINSTPSDPTPIEPYSTFRIRYFVYYD